MVAVLESAHVAPGGYPRHAFTALVVSPDDGRRHALAGRLRAIGAGSVVETASGLEARARASRLRGVDLCVVDGTVAEGGVAGVARSGLLGDLARRGSRHLVVLAAPSDHNGTRAALATGVRAMVVARERRSSPAAPMARPGRLRAAAPDDLSVREIEVLQHVASGRSNKEIGELLGLSALTVKSHLARIGRKLGTGDRAELVARGFRSGVVR